MAPLAFKQALLAMLREADRPLTLAFHTRAPIYPGGESEPDGTGGACPGYTHSL